MSQEAENTRYLNDQYMTEEGRNQEWWYRRYKAMLETAMLVEGMAGTAGFSNPIVSSGLAIMKSVNDVTDQMREIGASQKINKSYDLYINVDVSKGKDINVLQPLEAEGYEMLLGEEKYIPFT